MIDDVAVDEGDAGTTSATFCLRLSAATLRPVTVNYEVLGRTATADQDFRAASGVITIPASEREAKLAVHVIGDTVVEPTEQFVVKLTKAESASLDRAEAIGSIRNDDGEADPDPRVEEPRITITGDQVQEGHAGVTPLVFRVKLSAPGKQEIKVKYQTNQVTADEHDFKRAAGTLTIPAAREKPRSAST